MSNANAPRNLVLDDEKVRTRILALIEERQKGVCRKCEKTISGNDKITSAGRRRRYYHRECAELVNII